MREEAACCLSQRSGRGRQPAANGRRVGCGAAAGGPHPKLGLTVAAWIEHWVHFWPAEWQSNARRHPKPLSAGKSCTLSPSPEI